jgi:high affinity Mn2+ porin
MRLRVLLAALALLAAAYIGRAGAQDAATAESDDDWYSLHAQATFTDQFHPAFPSAYRGPNSLDPGNRGDETFDTTLFAGIRLWRSLEFFANPEIDQGFGLSDTLGVAAFPSAEAYKVGASEPYVRLQRAFLRWTIDLGGEATRQDPGQNQFADDVTADNLVLTVGKFSVVDIFDTNSYAHDPKQDFLDWAIVDAGAFDYAADAWGYSYGATAEWTQDWWTLRGGVFDLSREPNSKQLERGFGQFSVIGEVETRHQWWGQDGKIKLLAFVDQGRMGAYSDAVRLAAATGTVPNVADVRRNDARPGFVLNAEQSLTPDLGAFLRASINDGEKEAYEFTEINRSLSAGWSLKGTAWGRADDTVALAGVFDSISKNAVIYLAEGGLGILIGDGRLSDPGFEKVLETYYSLSLVKDELKLTADYQFIENPAYNRDRGPVSVLGIRLHAQL